MRKSNREVTRHEELTTLLDQCDVCRLGLSDDGQPYIVPLNFGYHWDETGLTLFFHCAGEGRKLDIIRRNNRVCFEMDHRHALKTGDLACQFSMNFESLIGEGLIEIVTDPSEKLAALNQIMRHYSDRTDWTFDEKVLAITTVLCLKATQFTGKRLNK